MVFKPSTLGNYPGNFDQVNDVCISQGSAVTFFFGFGRQMHIGCVKFMQDSVDQELSISARFH